MSCNVHCKILIYLSIEKIILLIFPKYHLKIRSVERVEWFFQCKGLWLLERKLQLNGSSYIRFRLKKTARTLEQSIMSSSFPTTKRKRMERLGMLAQFSLDYFIGGSSKLKETWLFLSEGAWFQFLFGKVVDGNKAHMSLKEVCMRKI